MLGRQEAEDVRQIVYQEMARIHWQATHCAGSYKYLCLVAGSPAFTHEPTGKVLMVLR